MSAPYYQDESVTLYLGDCREVLPALDVTADCIIADPPYGETSLAWDRWPDGWTGVAAAASRSMWCFGSLRMYLEHTAELPEATLEAQPGHHLGETQRLPASLPTASVASTSSRRTGTTGGGPGSITKRPGSRFCTGPRAHRGVRSRSTPARSAVPSGLMTGRASPRA